MSPEGINFFSISGLVGRNIHLWNIQSNPIHNLSVAQGYLIQIQLIFIIMHFSKRYFNIKRQHLAYSLIFGSIPVFIYGILQSDLYKIISTKYTVDPGATFQNGNHLSFYSALIFILMLWITVRKSLGTFILSILVSPLALWNLYIGRGRTALVSLILAIILSHINELFIILRTIQKRFYVNFSLLISASLVCIIVSSGAYYFWNQAGFLGLNEIETLVKNHDLIGLFYAGGRKQQFLQAWMAFQENWLIGLGTGAFFNLAGLNYEIHNSVLNIAVGSGIVPAILFILAFVAYIYTILFCIYQKKTKSISHNRVWSLTIALYLLICTIPDTFLSFRSLLSVSSCIICITIYNLLEIDYFKKYRLTFKRSLIVLSLLISFLSVLALLCPPKYYRSTHAYKDRNFDKVLNKNYRWHRQDTYWNLEASQCLTGEIFPFPNSKSKLEYQLGELDLDDLLSNFSNYTTHELFVKDQLDKSLYFDSRRWQNICICNSKKSTNTIYMSARQAELLSIAKTAYGKDDRVIAFGISEMKTFNIDKRKEKSCAQTIIF
ncbi:MAG: O-antigen ligase family protein [Oligoflexales bacterium]